MIKGHFEERGVILTTQLLDAQIVTTFIVSTVNQNAIHFSFFIIIIIMRLPFGETASGVTRKKYSFFFFLPSLNDTLIMFIFMLILLVLFTAQSCRNEHLTC